MKSTTFTIIGMHCASCGLLIDDCMLDVDGTTVPRLPGYLKWMWDGEFCGVIGFRWQPGTEALPPTCLGHIGYAVVPWKRGRGYATAALLALGPLAGEITSAVVDAKSGVSGAATLG